MVLSNGRGNEIQSLLVRDKKYQITAKSSSISMRVLEERYEYILQDLQRNTYQSNTMEPRVMDSVWFKVSSGEPQLLEAVHIKASAFGKNSKKSMSGLSKIDGTRWYFKPMFDRFEFGMTYLSLEQLHVRV